MTVSADRAAFVRKDYRYETAKDDSVLPDYPSAQPLELPTNLTRRSAEGLAATILKVESEHALVFEIEIEGAIDIGSLDGVIAHYTLSLPYHSTNTRTFKLISAEIDHANDLTTLRVKG